jgi:hypothetical protein
MASCSEEIPLCARERMADIFARGDPLRNNAFRTSSFRSGTVAVSTARLPDSDWLSHS